MATVTTVATQKNQVIKAMANLIEQNQTTKLRYVGTISFYVEAENDIEATKELQRHCDDLNKKHDCKATTEGLTQTTFGKIGGRKVF